MFTVTVLTQVDHNVMTCDVDSCSHKIVADHPCYAHVAAILLILFDVIYSKLYLAV